MQNMVDKHHSASLCVTVRWFPFSITIMSMFSIGSDQFTSAFQRFKSPAQRLACAFSGVPSLLPH
jgi:hypothetical protein